MQQIKTAVIIGAGNVAFHLCQSLSDNNLKPIYIHSQSMDSAEQLGRQFSVPYGNKISEIPSADLFLFAVSDDALSALSNNPSLKERINNALCAHTAGSLSMNALLPLSKKVGVFYPLQTFSKNISVDFSKVPLFIEANTEEGKEQLMQLSGKLSRKAEYMSENQREKLHPAAVFACNFVNFHLTLAERILNFHTIDFELLHPLIQETMRKALTHGPAASQTGPAARGDLKTIRKHSNLLKELPNIQKIYTFVSSQIMAQKNINKMDNFKERLKDIKGFVFDVDGVFSDLMILHTNGDLMRHMNVKDGFAVKTAVDAGYTIGIITGGDSESVKSRFERLGVKNIYLESPDKSKDFDDFLQKTGLREEQILYMGDDLPDYTVMKRCALATCPADAVEEIQAISHYISDKIGGQGCVRDVIEQVMRAQEKWQQLNGKG